MPNIGYKFDRWAGNVANTEASSTTITMYGAQTIIAYFVFQTYPKSLSQAKDLINSDADLIILDVSTPTNFNNSHMLCARSYPWNTGSNKFDVSITNLTPYKNNDILLYGQDGSKDVAAADYLARQGFSSVYYMTDGLDEWMSAGYATYMTAEDGAICTSIQPFAYAGPDKAVNENGTVKLAGEGPAGASFTWTQTKGTTVNFSPSANVAQPSIKAPDLTNGDEDLEFLLTVTSGGLKDSDSVTVHVIWNNQPPTANAGPDQTVKPGDKVTLDGSKSSDPEDTSSLTYNWSAKAPSGINPLPILSDPTAMKPTFTAPNQTGWIDFTLTVTDNGGLTDSDEVKITIQPAGNTPPVANAGSDQTVTEGNTVTLDGSKSSDSDGTITSYVWTQTSGPSVELKNSNTVKPTFTAPMVTFSTPLTFKLVVTDNDGAIGDDSVTITVNDSGSSVTPPSPPTQVSATDGGSSGGVNVTWNGSSGATSYDVYRADMPAWTGTSMTKIGTATGTSYDDTTAASGSRYYYSVIARNSAGVSKFSNFDAGYWGSAGSIPPVPTSVDATDGMVPGKVSVTWNASSSSLVYEIYRADIPAYLGGNIKKIGTATGLSYDDTTVVSGNRYYYWVKARNSWGVSRYSKFDTGYTGTSNAPPAAPENVVASKGSFSGKVTVNWAASTNAVLYEIWRATKLVSEGGKPVRVGYTSGTSFDNTTATSGTTYYYWVKARDSWGVSGYSSYDTGYCSGN